MNEWKNDWMYFNSEIKYVVIRPGICRFFHGPVCRLQPLVGRCQCHCVVQIAWTSHQTVSVHSVQFRYVASRGHWPLVRRTYCRPRSPQRVDVRCVPRGTEERCHWHRLSRRIPATNRTANQHQTRADFGGPDLGWQEASHQRRASHQTVSVLFLANDRCRRNYDLVVAHCWSLF